MITIIAGSRTCHSLQIVTDAIRGSRFKITQVISGGAKGVDRLGEQWAARNGIPVTIEPANWHKYGRVAGFMRNEKMGQQAQALVAVWDGQSPGTKNMIDIATQKGLEVYVHRF